LPRRARAFGPLRGPGDESREKEKGWLGGGMKGFLLEFFFECFKVQRKEIKRNLSFLCLTQEFRQKLDLVRVIRRCVRAF
jgi:hypothetical protein